MTQYNQTAHDTVVEETFLLLERDNAFADALVALFKEHPIPEWKHEMHRAVRGSALRKARAGGYRGRTPTETQRWREQVRENATEDWGVPADQVVAIHLLIYG